jgi:hypothetical protein
MTFSGLMLVESSSRGPLSRLAFEVPGGTQTPGKELGAGCIRPHSTA